MTSIAIINLILLAVRTVMYFIALYKENKLDEIENSIWILIHFLVIQFSIGGNL